MAEHSFAHTPDQRSVPAHERSEGSFIPQGNEALEKVRISQDVQFSLNDLLAKILDHPGDSHRSTSLGKRLRSSVYFPEDAVLLREFPGIPVAVESILYASLSSSAETSALKLTGGMCVLEPQDH
jgi:hypothetical protein